MKAFYSATKAALGLLLAPWTTDLNAGKIRVKSITPGKIDRPALGDLPASAKASEVQSIATSLQNKIRVFWVFRYIFLDHWTNNIYLNVVLAGPPESSFR